MKKNLPYILGVLAFIALSVIVVATNKSRPRKMDEHLSFKRKDKIPYGYYCAYKLLPSLFPNSTIYNDQQGPGYWDSLSLSESNQAVILVAPYFGAEDYELNKLLEFAKQGNHVFIITKTLSSEAKSFFNINDQVYSDVGFLSDDDSLTVQLESPPFSLKKIYAYPGKAFASIVSNIDSNHTLLLGKSKNLYPDFIQFKTGAGSISFHLAPLAFSNYFILHKNNLEYYNKCMSVIPGNVSKIVWNEYYLYKRSYNNPEKEPNWLSVLFRYKELKWALLTAMGTILLFVLLGMRRRQRMIPVYARPKNDSLDFAKTLGRLYHDKRDHTDLAKKMGSYFMDHVRSTYKLPTHELDEQFVQNLHFKTVYPIEEIRPIISFINYLEGSPPISEYQLSQFHTQLESFYQNT